MAGIYPSYPSSTLRVGLVGTGYAARLRAEALQQDPRAQLVAVSGRDLARAEQLSHQAGAIALSSWEEMLQTIPLDLVVIATINSEHSKIVRAALEAGLHVVVEYPLALDLNQAEALVALAKSQNRLLHIEHIELLGGVHQALKAALPEIGAVFYSRYATVKPEQPAPQRWTYHPQQFGFPLIGALSRLHRFTDLFGLVATVSCQNRIWDRQEQGGDHPYYGSCLCTAQLRFTSGLVAEVTYGKGEAFWQAERSFTVHGQRGTLVLSGDQGMLYQASNSHTLKLGKRQGLFVKDTEMVLDYLSAGTPLYVTPAASLYTLKVADAARRSAELGVTIQVEED